LSDGYLRAGLAPLFTVFEAEAEKDRDGDIAGGYVLCGEESLRGDVLCGEESLGGGT